MNYKRQFIENTMVFITVVTKNRQNILIDNISFLREAFKQTKEKYSFEIIAIIVNYDHFHMIIKPSDITQYPQIVGNIKKTFTQNSKLGYSLNKNRESSVWQRRYWEHTIIDEDDLNKHIDYIHYNSVKHYGISPKDWEYSSFRKFVDNGYYELNWSNFEDKYNIKNLNLE